ncbi:methyltransferase domain-containing protein [Nocardioides panacis]|uniref:Methyltransferase domain-containing protein n=1 Tax=Nocardioides panacis TaxID=2849501 RepID=A0A975SVC6_9ACTN|nr:methyltransferase domain-containing protein [Nocardioides panacis]QWZ06496.1 methyltransferase domain-containing protein [Nocardioides panacis]
MAGTGDDQQQWRGVDEGWGRRAVDFATLSEPANVREYVALHQRLGVGDGDSVLDVACGAGLALELAAARGATCAGIDASERALAGWARRVARDPNATTAEDVQVLRDAGFDDARILAVTAFVALRLAFSTVNDALGCRPDRAVVDGLPEPVSAAVTWGRPVEDA